MRYIVTGALGFIGYHLCQELLNQGHEVVGVDDFSTGSLDNRDPRLEFYKYNVADYSWDFIDFDDDDYHGVFHLADNPGVNTVSKNPKSALLTPINTTASVGYLAEFLNCPIVFASSSEVYSLNTKYDYPIGRSNYALGKYAAENYLFAVDVPHMSARIFNTIGPRQRVDSGHAIPNFVRLLNNHLSPRVHLPATQTRVWQDVRETVEILINGIQYMYAIDETIGTVDVASNNEYSVFEMALFLADISGTGEEPIVVNPPKERKDDPKERKPDNDWIKEKGFLKNEYYIIDTLEWIWKEEKRATDTS